MEANEMELQKRGKRWLVVGVLVGATALAGAVAGGKTFAPLAPATGTGRAASASNGSVTFSGTVDRTAVLVGGAPGVRMELVIGAKPGDERATAARVPTDLVVVLDRSGSMAGEKLEEAKAAIRELVSRLGAEDRFALVTYSNSAILEIAPAQADAGARARWLDSIAGISPDGGTNISGGLDLAIDTIEQIRAPGRAPRAILISDGLANQGDPTPEGLTRRAARAAHGEFPLTTVGVGADFNEYLMTALADAGTGNYYYLQKAQDLATVFAKEFDAARAMVASGVEVRIDPSPGVEIVDAAGYPLERSNGAVVFRPGSLFAGQERRIWVSLTVPNQSPGDHALGNVSLAYNLDGERSQLRLDDLPKVASVAREDDFYASVDVPAWSRSVLVDGYNKMQQEVARDVKEGRRDAAIAKVREFRSENEALNQRLKSPEVKQKLDALGKLEADVASTFQGENQAGRQNALSKAQSAAALDDRRVGAKR
jgi:Ca-activated chloride channel family protein